MDGSMKIVSTIVLLLLMFLAISAGVAKLGLMQQDVDFFGKYGFSNPMLIAFGVAQLIGGIFLAFRKTRFWGAAIVAVTFLISLVLLLIEGNVAVSIVTLVAIVLLGVVMKQSWHAASSEQQNGA